MDKAQINKELELLGLKNKLQTNLKFIWKHLPNHTYH
jgi:hypothetical protein